MEIAKHMIIWCYVLSTSTGSVYWSLTLKSEFDPQVAVSRGQSTCELL